ncbi:hypothetical protein KAU45_00910 [bacterium]|nr:hypothetical protein [bacterium]
MQLMTAAGEELYPAGGVDIGGAGEKGNPHRSVVSGLLPRMDFSMKRGYLEQLQKTPPHSGI